MPDASRSPRKKDARRITSNLLFLAFNHATAAICERCPAAVLKLKLPHSTCDHFIVLHFFFFWKTANYPVKLCTIEKFSEVLAS